MSSLKLFLTSSERKRSSTSSNPERTIRSKLSVHTREEGAGNQTPIRSRLRQAGLRNFVSDFLGRRKAKMDGKQRRISARLRGPFREVGRRAGKGYVGRVHWCKLATVTSNSNVLRRLMRQRLLMRSRFNTAMGRSPVRV